jgi:hypothetical protein
VTISTSAHVGVSATGNILLHRREVCESVTAV